MTITACITWTRRHLKAPDLRTWFILSHHIINTLFTCKTLLQYPLAIYRNHRPHGTFGALSVVNVRASPRYSLTVNQPTTHRTKPTAMDFPSRVNQPRTRKRLLTITKNGKRSTPSQCQLIDMASIQNVRHITRLRTFIHLCSASLNRKANSYSVYIEEYNFQTFLPFGYAYAHAV